MLPNHTSGFQCSMRLMMPSVPALSTNTSKSSESGISHPEVVKRLREEGGFRGFLMGEQFMKQADPGQGLADFLKQLEINDEFR